MSDFPRIDLPHIDRRDFVKLAGSAVVVSATETALAAPKTKVCLFVDEEPRKSPPVQWALDRLQQELTRQGIDTESIASLGNCATAHTIVVISPSKPTEFMGAAPLPNGPESLSLIPGTIAGIPTLLVSATDPRGFVYALLELAERVRYASNPIPALRVQVNEAPANKVRSVARAFCSELEDKPWFYDKQFWHGYLDVLALSRFNRFNFTLGLAYDFPKGVTDDYFHFPYPYLLDVPGYDVRAVPLGPGEREKNLAMLQFIAAETAKRGLQFQLGLWTHAYAWTDSPDSTHHIVGLTPETHAAYCRDALALLLKKCPEIEGLTFRVHGESGIPEGSYPFWKTLFSAIPASGRTIEIDMHAKGINQEMFDIAAATGMPVKVSAKFWAEHQGLGYHQADIRAQEIPKPGHKEQGVFAVSNGERSFTRYGYADLFQEGRKFDVLFRMWPGTQRHLLWGDVDAAAAYGRAAHFCGASGMELFEPLFFKGREGSGLPGGRCAYADATLNPDADWKKFEYTYRLWGRLLYNPDADPEAWRRYLRSDFGVAAPAVEEAVTNAGRILPLLTTAHLPSASNHSLWCEIYDNMPIVLGKQPSPYSDTPTPRCFATVSPLDPQLFSTIADHAKDIASGTQGAKYSPIEVSHWLQRLADTSDEALSTAMRMPGARTRTAQFRRMQEDVLIQIGLGRFFAAKLRSGVLFEFYKQSSDPHIGQSALTQYRKARDAWAKMAERAKSVYRADISYGSIPMRRGHWIDRLQHIDEDIAAMEAQVGPTSRIVSLDEATSLRLGMDFAVRPDVKCAHTQVKNFRPGQPLALRLEVADVGVSSLLHYRHVNHGERWLATPMERQGTACIATIPAAYTDSPYPLQYYFQLSRDKTAWLYPAFNATLSNQPYYAVWKRAV
jgi:hypothetical protein